MKLRVRDLKAIVAEEVAKVVEAEDGGLPSDVGYFANIYRGYRHNEKDDTGSWGHGTLVDDEVSGEPLGEDEELDEKRKRKKKSLPRWGYGGVGLFVAGRNWGYRSYNDGDRDEDVPADNSSDGGEGLAVAEAEDRPEVSESPKGSGEHPRMGRKADYDKVPRSKKLKSESRESPREELNWAISTAKENKMSVQRDPDGGWWTQARGESDDFHETDDELISYIENRFPLSGWTNKRSVKEQEGKDIMESMESGSKVPRSWEEFRKVVASALSSVSEPDSGYGKMARSLDNLDDEGAGFGGVIDRLHEAWIDIEAERDLGKETNQLEWETDVEFYVYDVFIDVTSDSSLASKVVDAVKSATKSTGPDLPYDKFDGEDGDHSDFNSGDYDIGEEFDRLGEASKVDKNDGNVHGRKDWREKNDWHDPWHDRHDRKASSENVDESEYNGDMDNLSKLRKFADDNGYHFASTPAEVALQMDVDVRDLGGITAGVFQPEFGGMELLYAIDDGELVKQVDDGDEVSFVPADL